MSALKKLAGQTAIYGLSTILPRFLNYLLTPLLTYIIGYGPILCAVTVDSYIKQARRAEARWDKTEKVGRVTA